MGRRFRCPECRTRRTSYVALLKHCRDHGHALCHCGGYHFVHRPGSPCCERHPMGAVHAAVRAGASPREVWDVTMDVVWHTPGTPMKEWKMRDSQPSAALEIAGKLLAGIEVPPEEVAGLIERLHTENEVLQVQLDGAAVRMGLMRSAKERWRERAIAAEGTNAPVGP